MQRALRPVGLAAPVLLSLLLAASAYGRGPSPSDFNGAGKTSLSSRTAPSSDVGRRTGTDVKNLATGLSFATIQDAINDANTVAGNILEVQVASHAEGLVTVNKGVTIRGGSGGAVITPTTNTGDTGDARGWFLITAAGVTFQDLDFNGTGYLIYQALRFTATASGAVERCDFLHIGGTPSSYDGRGIATQGPVTVSRCTFIDMRRIGVHVFGPSANGTVVDGCTYTGKGTGDWLDYGVELGGGAVATLTNDTITGCTGVASVDQSTSAGVLVTDYFAPGTAGTLTGNFITGCTSAIADGFLTTDASVTTAHGNDLSGDTYGIVAANPSKVVDASANWWGSNVAGTVAAYVGTYADFTPWLHVGTDTSVAAGFQGSYATLDVDDSSPQAGATGRIQEAVGLVSGSTVNVMPGTYEEQVVVNGLNVVLQGSGKATTFIRSPVTLATAFTSSGNPHKPIVAALHAADVEVRDFTIDGLGRGNVNNRMDGVAFWDAGGKVVNCDILEIRDTPLSGVQHGVGVYAYNDTNGPYSIEVGGCTIADYQKNAMALSGAGLTVNVHDCSTVGAGSTSITAQNGIQVSYGASGSVSNCSMTAMRYAPGSTVAAGLLLYQGGSFAVTGISLVDVQESVYWQDGPGGSLDGVNISYVSGAADYDGILLYNTTTLARAAAERPAASPFVEAGGAASLRSAMAVTVSNGCVTGTGATGSIGVDAYSTGQPLTVDVSNLRVTNFDYGFGPGGASASLDVADCSITGNLTAAYDNTGSGHAQDARHNWWGSASGPGAAVLGSGVDYSAWRMDGGSSTPCAFTPINNSFNTITPVPPVGCITSTACMTVPVNIQRYDSANLRAFSVTFTLSPELVLCTPGSIVEGTYLSSVPPAPHTTFQVVSNGGGSYTVDGSILGLPCGQTAPTGTLFTVGVKKSGADGTGTITLGQVLLRDCANAPISVQPGAPASITIDTAGPSPVANLVAVQKKTGNTFGSDTTGVTLTFTAPGDAAVTEVWAAPFGNYPEYDDAPGAGAVPTTPTYPPSPPWQLTSVTASGQNAYMTTRDFWYFVVFTKDACGNVSAVSNKTGGTLNYHLGDVTDGITNGHGDNRVNGTDVSHLGGHYGINLAVSDPWDYLDVGPTTDSSVNARPMTDNKVNFEDLMMFAINFGQVSKALPSTPQPGILRDPSIAMKLDASGERVLAHLSLNDNGEVVKGVHASLSFDRSSLELVGVSQGTLLQQQGGPVFLGKVDEASGVSVDAARLGEGAALSGDGEVAVVEFRRLAGTSLPTLADAALRDVNNHPASRHPVDVANEPALASPAVQASLPARIELVGARPNPFGSATEIVFRLPASTSVSVHVYDVTGRLVRALQDGTLDPGEHVARWDGRTADGSLAASGIYFYTFRANDVRETRKLIYTR